MHQFRLHIDLESRSECNLKAEGIGRYARHPSTEILMFSWALDDEEVQIWFPLWEPMPKRLRNLLLDPTVKKCAQNYRFEREMLMCNEIVQIDVPIEQWEDTKVMAYRLSLPGNLAELGQVIGVPEAMKDKRGERLIQVFCKPRPANQVTTKKPWAFNDWKTHPAEWREFCDYNKQDVRAERKLGNLMRKYEVPAIEDEIWHLDEHTNARGMPIDLEFVQAAWDMVRRVKKKYVLRTQKITGVLNGNAPAQVLPWLRKHGYPFKNMKAASIEAAINDFAHKLNDDVLEVLRLRQGIAKTSCNKYKKMLIWHVDGWLKYCFEYGGAQRTLRWSGRGPQLQNLPSRFDESYASNIPEIRDLILSGDDEWIEIMFGDPLEALSACIRSAIVAPEGMKIVSGDLSSIESRAVAGISKCKAMLDVFASGRDMYKVFAAGLFKKAYDAVTKYERNFCKPPVLGSGFGLGAGEIKGEYPLEEYTGLIGYAKNMGVKLTVEEGKVMTDFFRNTYEEVPLAWWALEEAAVTAVRTKKRTQARAKDPKTGAYNAVPLGIWFDVCGPFLRVQLPSGRYMYYLRPQVHQEQLKSKRTGNYYTKYSLSYEGYDDKKRWTRIRTYGGKWMENLAQAWAREVMAHGMLDAAKRGFQMLGTVHDELIGMVRADKAAAAVKYLCKLLCKDRGFSMGLTLGAEGFYADFYGK